MGPRKQVPGALVIAPTRELAEQINDAILELGLQTRLNKHYTSTAGRGCEPAG